MIIIWIEYLVRFIHMKFDEEFNLYRSSFQFLHQVLFSQQAQQVKVKFPWGNYRTYHHTMLKWKFHYLVEGWNYLRCYQWWWFCSSLYLKDLDPWPRKVRSMMYVDGKVSIWYYYSHRSNQPLDRHTLTGLRWRWRSHSIKPLIQWIGHNQVWPRKSCLIHIPHYGSKFHPNLIPACRGYPCLYLIMEVRMEEKLSVNWWSCLGKLLFKLQRLLMPLK